MNNVRIFVCGARVWISLKVAFAGNFRVKHDFSGGMVERVSRNEQFEKESS